MKSREELRRWAESKFIEREIVSPLERLGHVMRDDLRNGLSRLGATKLDKLSRKLRTALSADDARWMIFAAVDETKCAKIVAEREREAALVRSANVHLGRCLTPGVVEPGKVQSTPFRLCLLGRCHPVVTTRLRNPLPVGARRYSYSPRFLGNECNGSRVLDTMPNCAATSA